MDTAIKAQKQKQEYAQICAYDRDEEIEYFRNIIMGQDSEAYQ